MTFVLFWISNMKCRWHFSTNRQTGPLSSKSYPLFFSLETASPSEVIICNGNLKKKVFLRLFFRPPNLKSEGTINLYTFWIQTFSHFSEKPFPINFVLQYFRKKFWFSSSRILCTGFSYYSRHYLIVKNVKIRHIGQKKHLVLELLD